MAAARRGVPGPLSGAECELLLHPLRRHFGGAPLCDRWSDTSGCWPELGLPPPRWPMGGAGAAAAAAGTCPSSLATAGPLESPAVATQAATAGAGARSSFGNMKPDPLTHPLTMTLDSTRLKEVHNVVLKRLLCNVS